MIVRLLSIVIALAIVGTACSGESGDAVSPEVQGFLDRLGDDVPVSQAAALEDGVITFEEYEAAYERTVACMRDSGMLVDGPSPVNGGRFLGYSYQGGPGDGEADALCRREHLSLVDMLWRLQAIPSEEEAVQILADYRQCVADAGVPVGEDVTLDELEIIVGEVDGYDEFFAIVPCIEQYSVSSFVSGR